ncbi:hypothetical protein KFK09_006901 [Dendrobium nobile]|uniref:Reverse transcriptase Ty1/copia-type domain-containing protein n=1 Tax=Dendrobium nobile TaxID=94219 RepID=A0A8T3BVB6_DENNO|nr:hypothetical protein KFK09_006901 [Dendrobium nobile]
MKQSPRFVDKQFPNHICLLKKAIYGWKQAPREWFSTFSAYLIQYGFRSSSADPSLLLFNHNSIQLYILVYVDDILLTGNSTSEIDNLLTALHVRFSMRNLGPVSQFLGLQITSTATGLHLAQSIYATSILHKAGMVDCKPVSTPLPTKFLRNEQSDDLYERPEHYHQITGALQYLMITRPDLLYAVNFLCQHMHQPLQTHYNLLKRVLRYVKVTLSLGLPIRPTSLQLTGYADSDWAADHLDRRSITGYCAFLGHNLISWIVKKQSSVTRSSTEAEYRPLSTATCDLIWLRRLLAKFQSIQTEPTKLYCDNVSALALATNPVFHARTKHIEIDAHFIRDCVRTKQLSVHHICSQDQPAGLFTKSLSSTRHLQLCDKITIQPSIVILREADKNK